MNKPEKTFENGSCRASIFLNEVSILGETKKIPSIVINRSYMDKDNEWKKTDIFRVNDLPKLRMVALKAYDYLTVKNKKTY